MTKKKTKESITRRDIVKGLAAVPVLGVFAYQFSKMLSLKQKPKVNVLQELGFKNEAPAIGSGQLGENSEKLRIAIIGTGPRGMSLLESAGYRTQKDIDKVTKSNISELTEWASNDDLNIELAGICDVFDERAEEALDASTHSKAAYISGQPLSKTKRYKHYLELLDDKTIDAVMIATPDHHHAQMTIDAIQAGKHVYCEKALCRTEEEVFKVESVVKSSDRVFQLGHQYTHSPVFKKAKQLVDQGILGPVALVETTTNRNSSSGAWTRHLKSDGTLKSGNPQSIDWKQWLGNSQDIPFSLERYYGWTKWFDYGNGPWGQLFSHEYDAINGLLGLGIPKSCNASGGVYYWKDGRETPDTFNAVFEYPESELSLLYSLCLTNSKSRGRVIMGRDATMELGGTLKVTADGNSARYDAAMREGLISSDRPFYSYGADAAVAVDGMSSATAKYYAERGLSGSKFNGKSVDLTYMHIKDWLTVIRNGGTPRCNIDIAVDEMITILMATKSYQEGRKVTWDNDKRRIV